MGHDEHPAQREAVLRLLHSVLGEDLVGAYAHGSAVFGGLRPHSDIDVLAVTAHPTTAAQRRALVEALLKISGAVGPGGVASDPAGSGPRPVELTVVVHRDVRPWRFPPLREFQYGEWLRTEYERGFVPAPTPDPDLAPVLRMVLLGDAPLSGPPPHEVLDPVPDADLRHALLSGMPDLLAALDDDARNVVLTLTRIWATLATGTMGRKDDAAEWALPRLPAEHRPVLARALAVYLGEEADRWDDLRPLLRGYADYATRAIMGLAAPGS